MSIPVIAGLILASFALGLMTLPLLISFAHSRGLLDRPGRHKRHKRPVPYLGGVGLFLAVWIPVGLGYIFIPEMLVQLTPSILYILAGAAIIFGIGFLDDIRSISAWVKLAAQAVAGVVLFAGGLQIDPLSVPFYGQITLGALSLLISVLWVVGLTNAINIIDGLDGLAGGVSLVAAITLAIVGNLYNTGESMIFAYLLVGYLPAFLLFNRHPAKLFLGDSGALQIGYYFAVLSLMVPLKSYTAAALYVPLLALGVPLLETAVSAVRRLVAGKSPMRADRRHLFHYLSMAGLSPRTVVWVFWLLSVVFGCFALAMFFWDRILVFTLLVLFMVVIFGGFYIFMASLPHTGKDRRGAGK